MVVGGDTAEPRILDRRRVDLWDRRTPLQAYHAAKGGPANKAEAVVRRAAEAARAMAEQAVRELVADVEATGCRVASGGVMLGSRGHPQSLPVAGVSHAGAHFAEGEMYRGALMDALTACRLDTTGVREKDLEEQAALALQIDDPMGRVTRLGRELGPPWTKDHKFAALVAWMALIRP